jgi:hypothetical protein
MADKAYKIDNGTYRTQTDQAKILQGFPGFSKI